MRKNWNHLIEACKKQDPVAQEELYKHCYPGMIRICLRYCQGQHDIAAGLFNQSMLKVFRNLDQFAGLSTPEGWIKRIVVNTCIDHCRLKKLRWVEVNETVADKQSFIPDVYSRLQAEEIMRLVYELPENTALVFNLYVMEGYKHEEIGQQLGISAGTSKWHLSEARKLLKQKLETLLKKDTLANAI